MIKMIYRTKPPCPKCPYTLGTVHTLKNPCPECKTNGYKTYEIFLGERFGGTEIHSKKGKSRWKKKKLKN